MFLLESSDDLGRKLTFPLVKVMTVIGRDPNCDIVLADSDVSRQHAKIYLMGNSVKIKDESSINGTYVNNRLITEMVELPNNAEVIIGSNQFFLRQVAEMEEDNLQLTTILTVDQLRDITDVHDELLDDMPPNESELGMTVVADKRELLENIYLKKINFAVYPSLEIIFGPDKGKKFLLPYGEHRLGRQETCNVRLSDAMVSGLHGTIEVKEGEVVYTDEGSRNGSVLNNKIVDTHPLQHRDVLVLGNTKLKFTHPEQARLEASDRREQTMSRTPVSLWKDKRTWFLLGAAGLFVVLLFILLSRL